VKLNPNNFSQA